jgi:hypothetical protein
MFNRFFSPSKEDAQRVGECVADENIRFGLVDADAQFFQADGGVHHDRDDAQLEQREGEGEEVGAGRSQQGGAHARGRRAGLKSAGEAPGGFQ